VQETFITDQPRARRYGAGRPPKLNDDRDKLLFILVYFRLYPTQEVQGFLFDLSQSQTNEWVHKLTGILNQALGHEKQLPEREPSRLAAVLNACPTLEFIIDGTEWRMQRPKNSQRQRDYYSGKKKTHTMKNNVISNRKGKVEFVSDTYPGRVHDKSISDGEEYKFPLGSHLWQDTGFQGFAPAGVTIHQPKKKPKNGALTAAEKDKNREISKERVEIEHQIGGIKRCKIVTDIFRNRKDYTQRDSELDFSETPKNACQQCFWLVLKSRVPNRAEYTMGMMCLKRLVGCTTSASTTVNSPPPNLKTAETTTLPRS
jgi:hypothetical protein